MVFLAVTDLNLVKNYGRITHAEIHIFYAGSGKHFFFSLRKLDLILLHVKSVGNIPSSSINAGFGPECPLSVYIGDVTKSKSYDSCTLVA